MAASNAYDDAGGLINEALDNVAFLWQPPATLARTIAYDPASPINALTKVDGVTQTHDARGNRTGAAGRTWRYDTRNMLVGANAPGMATTYGYYPEGGRAWKQVSGVTTLYLELDGIEWGSYDPNGSLKERTIRASGNGGAVVAIHSPTAGLIRLLPNRQGSVIGWLRPDGKLGGAYTYDAYGNSPQAGAAGPSFRYAGMRFDAETGLYHTPNRAYDPQDGRWMQLDPIGIKDGLNRYAYVKNDPINFIDSAGQSAIAVHFRDQQITMPGSDMVIPQIISGGHSGVVLINDNNGRTMYKEFGRYNGTLGMVRSLQVPNLTLDKQGIPTPGSIKAILNRLISIECENRSGVEIEFTVGTDYTKMRAELGKWTNKNWSVFGSTCHSFCKNVVESGGDLPSEEYVVNPESIDEINSAIINQYKENSNNNNNKSAWGMGHGAWGMGWGMITGTLCRGTNILDKKTGSKC